MKLKHDGTYWRYGSWYIYQESMGNLFSHCFFHENFDGAVDSDTNHLQGTAQSLEDAVNKINEMETEKC
jgi:hypothetical protein